MKTFFTITYLLLSVWSFGQWTPLNVSMNNNFIDVQFVNDSVGFISGSGGALLKTTDYGLSWTNVNNTGNSFAFSFHFPGDSVGYALGGNSLFKTVDQGINWVALPAISTFDKNNPFFLNDSTGFFLAAYGIIYKTTDGGMNWSNFSTNCSETIVEEDIYFPDQNTGYFGGWYGTCASRTMDEGNTWQVLDGNLLSTIKAIYFPSVSTGYMAGYVNWQTGGVQKTTDSGNTWIIQNTPIHHYNSIYCTDTSTCYAVAYDGAIIKTTDGGANWQQQISGTTHPLRKIYCTDANTCYAVGDSGTVLKTMNGGVTGMTNYLSDIFDITIFPNPASDKLTINLHASDYEVAVYDSMGERICKIRNQNKLDVSNFSDGIYFVKVFDGRNYYCKKMIVKHD